MGSGTRKLEHVAIDLETMALTPDCAIVSIGAVLFDPRYGRVSKKSFYTELDWEAQDRVKDAETAKWWKGLPIKIQDAIYGLDDLSEQLVELAEWLPKDAKVWGNGAIFDIAILENAYRQYGIDIPWAFWNVRDMRTLKDMYECKRGSLERKPDQNLHNALYDARLEAELICKMWSKTLS